MDVSVFDDVAESVGRARATLHRARVRLVASRTVLRTVHPVIHGGSDTDAQASAFELIALVHDMLDRGELAAAVPRRMYAGYGKGAKHCSICRYAIQATEIECEVDCDTEHGRTTLFLHRRCFDAWRIEVELRS